MNNKKIIVQDSNISSPTIKLSTKKKKKKKRIMMQRMNNKKIIVARALVKIVRG